MQIKLNPKLDRLINNSKSKKMFRSDHIISADTQKIVIVFYASEDGTGRKSEAIN